MPISDYYRYHPWRDDGGYLRALVETCRAELRSASFLWRVRPLVVREAERAQVLALNHDTNPADRDEALQALGRAASSPASSACPGSS